jgi:hypothetical protein
MTCVHYRYTPATHLDPPEDDCKIHDVPDCDDCPDYYDAGDAAVEAGERKFEEARGN